MARFRNTLDHVRIAAPCPADWDQMIGSERMRFCGQCSLNVYNLSSMTRSEAESLIARNEGRLWSLAPDFKEPLHDRLERLGEGRGVGDHVVSDAVNSARARWDRTTRVHKSTLEHREESRAIRDSLHETVGDRNVGKRTDAGCFEVETYVAGHVRRRFRMCTNASERPRANGG